MTRRRTDLGPLWLIAILAGGCGADADDAGPAAGVRIDTIGEVVHVISGGRGVWDEEGGAWRVEADQAVTIGEAEGPEAFVFGRMAGVYVGDDGRVYAADGQARETRVFSPAGEFITRFGRDGEGPGEFGHIGGIGRAPDGGIAVLDGRLGRVSLFDASGAFRQAFRLERPFMILTTGESVRFDGAGRFLDVTKLSRGIDIDSIGVVRYSPEGAVEDTTLIAVHEPHNVLFEEDGVPVMSMPVPFAPRPSAAVGPDGAIYATLGGEYRIARFAPGGDTVLVIRRTVAPVKVSTADRDSARAALIERHRAAVGAEPRDLPAIPEHEPAIVGLRVDDLGFLWVLRSSEATEWDVFEPGGRFLGTLVLPGTMNVMHIGEGSIAGVVYDDLDVPNVVILPLHRGPSTES